MSGNGGGTLCGVCTCFIVIPSFIMIMMSFSSLQSVEYGLDYNAITLTVDNRTYDSAGLYFLGLGHSFIKFPRTIQTIEFNAAHADLLHTRTLDGLPLYPPTFTGLAKEALDAQLQIARDNLAGDGGP